MPLNIIREDITKLDVDVIVDPTNRDMVPETGACRHIFETAGKEQLESECAKFGKLGYGEIAVTSAGKLPAKKIIHTVGPVWSDGHMGEEIILRTCYTKSLEYAASINAESIAFPLISAGHRYYPRESALRAASDAIKRIPWDDHEMNVYLVVYDNEAFGISQKLYDEVEDYLDANYEGIIEERSESVIDRRRKRQIAQSEQLRDNELKAKRFTDQSKSVSKPVSAPSSVTIRDIEKRMGETFSERLLRYIKEKNKTDTEVYKKANIDRKHFSKIRSNREYKPTKYTVMAFVVALELSMDEARDLLQSAGFAFTDSSKFDIIVQFFISHGEYDIFKINEALYSFNQHLLGA